MLEFTIRELPTLVASDLITKEEARAILEKLLSKIINEDFKLTKSE